LQRFDGIDTANELNAFVEGDIINFHEGDNIDYGSHPRVMNNSLLVKKLWESAFGNKVSEFHFYRDSKAWMFTVGCVMHKPKCRRNVLQIVDAFNLYNPQVDPKRRVNLEGVITPSVKAWVTIKR
jgi:hypothetical protein